MGDTPLERFIGPLLQEGPFDMKSTRDQLPSGWDGPYRIGVTDHLVAEVHGRSWTGGVFGSDKIPSTSALHLPDLPAHRRAALHLLAVSDTCRMWLALHEHWRTCTARDYVDLTCMLVSDLRRRTETHFLRAIEDLAGLEPEEGLRALEARYERIARACDQERGFGPDIDRRMKARMGASWVSFEFEVGTFLREVHGCIARRWEPADVAPREPAAAAGDGAGRHRAPGTDAPNPAMVRDGTSWRISHEGTTGTYPDIRGFRVLVELLAKPNTDIDCLVLAGRVRECNWAPGLQDRRAVAEIEQALADAERRGAAPEAAELREELERARRRPEAPDISKARKAVGKALAVALETIKSDQRALAAELRRDISTPYGRVVSYRPAAGAVPWLVRISPGGPSPQRGR